MLELYIFQDWKIEVSFFKELKKFDRDHSYWQVLSLFCLWNTTWHYSYPINTKARAKMVVIMNKVSESIEWFVKDWRWWNVDRHDNFTVNELSSWIDAGLR